MFQSNAAQAAPREKESPIVRVGSGSGVLLTNTIIATHRSAFRFVAPPGASIVDFIGTSVLIDDDLNPTVDHAISALGVIYKSQ